MVIDKKRRGKITCLYIDRSFTPLKIENSGKQLLVYYVKCLKVISAMNKNVLNQLISSQQKTSEILYKYLFWKNYLNHKIVI